MKPVLWILLFIPYLVNHKDVNTPGFFKPRVQFIFKMDGQEKAFLLNKEDQKAVKNYCKEKSITLITEEAVKSEYDRKLKEIIESMFKPGDLEEKQKKAKDQLLSIPEIVRKAELTFYITEPGLPDSTRLAISSFPYNQKDNTSHTRAIIHPKGTLMIDCIRATIDTCVANKYFD
ncbi:MAG: hypothetical protein J0L56_03790 [Chitinophagales bacterium]|nr:hypothetical protein [Chitinophagales bacterium]